MTFKSHIQNTENILLTSIYQSGFQLLLKHIYDQRIKQMTFEYNNVGEWWYNRIYEHRKYR